MLATNLITPNSEQCLEFFFFQEQGKAGILNIYAKLLNQNLTSLGFPVWTELNLQDEYNMWNLVQVPLGHTITGTPFQIIFEELVSGKQPGTN